MNPTVDSIKISLFLVYRVQADDGQTVSDVTYG